MIDRWGGGVTVPDQLRGIGWQESEFATIIAYGNKGAVAGRLDIPRASHQGVQA